MPALCHISEALLYRDLFAVTDKNACLREWPAVKARVGGNWISRFHAIAIVI
jgi:hypothetical protein